MCIISYLALPDCISIASSIGSIYSYISFGIGLNTNVQIYVKIFINLNNYQFKKHTQNNISKEMSDIVKKNRLLLYFYELISTFVLYYAVDTLFYLERGISSSGYILFVVVTFIIQLLFELPSGVLADKYGKKKILIFSQSVDKPLEFF